MKITLLGKSVGKTSLIYSFINRNVPQEHDPTIEERYKTSINIKGQDYEVDILDTAGEEEEYPHIEDMWISFGEGFLLVFAINNLESFEEIKPRYKKILKGKHGVKCPILLVGNKQDLKKERKVAYAEAKQLADSWGIEYIETCPKNNFNCIEAFEKLAQKIVKAKATPKPKPSCNIK